MAKNSYLSEFMTPCKWGKRPYRQSPIRKVTGKAKTIYFFFN